MLYMASNTTDRRQEQMGLTLCQTDIIAHRKITVNLSLKRLLRPYCLQRDIFLKTKKC